MLSRTPHRSGTQFFPSTIILLAATIAASFMLLVGARPALAQAVTATAVPDGGASSEVDLFLPFTAVPQAVIDPAGPICRFGVNVAMLPVSDFDVAALRVGWYVDYHTAAAPAHPNGAAYTQIVGLKQVGSDDYASTPSGTELDAVVAANLGSDWIIGNEPDRRIFQDSMVPAAYAHAYHDLYYQIKAADPTARIFAGAIVQPTPLRLEYLDSVLRAYASRYGEAMPVDGWAIHNFILNERSCDYYNDPSLCWGADIPPGSSATDGLVITIDELAKTGDVNFFKAQIVRFRQWMHDRGYGDKAMIVSEYGILMPPSYGFPAEVVSQYMTDTFNYMLTQTDPVLGFAADDNRLVQKFSWYSTSDIAFNGSLFESTTSNPSTPPFKLSLIGENYRNFTAPIQVASDVKLVRLDVLPPAPLASRAPVTLTLRATVGNRGNNVTAATASVTFYDGDPAAGGVQIGASQPVSLAGCGMTQQVEVQWPNVPASANGKSVYAKISTGGATDPALSTRLFFAAENLLLPIVRRGF